LPHRKFILFFYTFVIPAKAGIQFNINRMNINKLMKIIRDRKLKMPKESYVASLFKAGQDRIIQKVGEEATEVIIAAKNKNKKRIISEVADLLFHLLILLIYAGISFSNIEEELEKRN